MKIVKGDAVKALKRGDIDVLVHGCNCFNTMGKGIAFQIKREFPEAYRADQATTKGDNSKLGDFTFAKTKNGGIIVNAYTQYGYRGFNGPDVDYNAIRSCFYEIALNFPFKKIAYPMIGAGLAGGDWEIISEIIDEELHGYDHTLYIL